MYDLTGFQRDLLYVIAGLEGAARLAIKEELEAYYEKEIHHGRLYPNLDTLVEKGLVDKGQRDRRTNYYTLTRRGRREIDARREWEDQYVDLEDVAPRLVLRPSYRRQTAVSVTGADHATMTTFVAGVVQDLVRL